jgi:hypothetical protein
MMNKTKLIQVVGFCFAFIFLGAGGFEVWATQMAAGDTVELVVDYNTAYPGRFVEIAVLMKNPVPICGFDIQFTLGGWDLADFRVDSTYADSESVPIDTCPSPDIVCTVDTCSCGEGEPDTCACMTWDHFTVRDCFLDTVGSLINNWGRISSHCCTPDTNRPCECVTVLGLSALLNCDNAIPPRANYDTLFRLGVDLSCLCDVDTGRKVYFLVSSGFTHFSDDQGHKVPFKYYMGELLAWWSEPGDANGDGLVSAADLVFLLNYLFQGGPEPCIWEAADPDSSGEVNAADIVWLLNYLFLHGPAPLRGYGCPDFPTRKIDGDFESFEPLNLQPLSERR